MNGKQSKFKNDVGVHLTKSIFWEFDQTENRAASVYTLKDEDHTVDGVVYPSLRRLYIHEADLTEYNFAVRYLDGWSHWKKIKNQGWFRDYYKEWREELEVKVQAAALANIAEKALDKDCKEHFQASKYLLEQGWIEKEKKPTGPRTKEKIRQEAESIVRDKNELLDDYNRILGKPNA